MTTAVDMARTRRTVPPGPRAHYDLLMAHSRGRSNDPYLAQMIVAWDAGVGVLPRWMGLSPSAFCEMIAFHFPKVRSPLGGRGESAAHDREPEIADLRALLLSHRAGRCRSERWMAEIVCAGCMGHDHLWSDLGLFSRPHLTELMELNFPRLAARNPGMRWKRYFYKELCRLEGFYMCRSPTCEQCSEYAQCFFD